MIDEGFSQIFLRKCGADEKFLAGTCGKGNGFPPVGYWDGDAQFHHRDFGDWSPATCTVAWSRSFSAFTHRAVSHNLLVAFIAFIALGWVEEREGDDLT